MDAEVQRIYDNAQQATRSLYDLAVDRDMPERPNWIIRVSATDHRACNLTKLTIQQWMLWHVFRYRDGRQQSANRSSSRDAVSDEDIGPSTTINATSMVVARPVLSAPGTPLQLSEKCITTDR